MSRPLVIGAVALAAVAAGALWFVRAPSEGARAVPAAGTADPGTAVKLPVSARPELTRGSAASRPAAPDPRLAVLLGSSDATAVDFLLDADGRLVKEVDADPASAGYRRPLREYTYAGDKLISLVKYRYTDRETQIIRADVVYRPDGSVDQYHETTRYEYGR